MLKNKNAMIWAFDEVISGKTDFDGNTSEDSISLTKDIINYLISKKCVTVSIDLSILNAYLRILNRTETRIPSKVIHDSEYVLCGWKGHAILLFWEKQMDGNNYKFGLINCGKGAGIQGSNGFLCNGLIIFENISKEKINNFLTYYHNYYNNTIDDHQFKYNNLYYMGCKMLILKN